MPCLNLSKTPPKHRPKSHSESTFVFDEFLSSQYKDPCSQEKFKSLVHRLSIQNGYEQQKQLKIGGSFRWPLNSYRYVCI